MNRPTTLFLAALLVAPGIVAAQQPAPKPPASTAKMAPKPTKAEKEAQDAKAEAALMKEAKVTEAAARAIALKEVPGGVVKEHELEREKGKLIWSYDIAVAGKSGIEEVNIDAMTGKMLAHEHETPKDEKKEAAEDAAKAKARTGVKKP
ncbi:MAG: PepSY domain-containing protein [Gemmatimonadota bacterium]